MKPKTDFSEIGDILSENFSTSEPHDEGQEFQPEDRMNRSIQRVSIAAHAPAGVEQKANHRRAGFGQAR